MTEDYKNLKQRIEQIIDTLELHTTTKEDEKSKDAVIDAYKSLYILKDYFENKIIEELNS